MIRDILSVFFGTKKAAFLSILFVSFMVGYASLAIHMENQRAEKRELKRKNDIILKGRADKENGLGFNTNPYLVPEDRELWRFGWRNSREIKE